MRRLKAHVWAVAHMSRPFAFQFPQCRRTSGQCGFRSPRLPTGTNNIASGFRSRSTRIGWADRFDYSPLLLLQQPADRLPTGPLLELPALANRIVQPPPCGTSTPAAPRSVLCHRATEVARLSTERDSKASRVFTRSLAYRLPKHCLSTGTWPYPNASHHPVGGMPLFDYTLELFRDPPGLRRVVPTSPAFALRTCRVATTSPAHVWGLGCTVSRTPEPGFSPVCD